MRLDKYIALAKGVSRKAAHKLISDSVVRIDGIVCRDAAHKLSSNAAVTYMGEELSAESFVYIMLDKPVGVVSASRGAGEVTVVDLVQSAYPSRTLFPAGRLDKASTGFVLITDDGDFAHNILSPRHHVSKTYEVVLDTALTAEMIAGFSQGVCLADGTQLSPAELSGELGSLAVQVVLRQGVYHQIKRMFGVYGAGVNELRRTKIGGLALDKSLGAGGFRAISVAELENITSL